MNRDALMSGTLLRRSPRLDGELLKVSAGPTQDPYASVLVWATPATSDRWHVAPSSCVATLLPRACDGDAAARGRPRVHGEATSRHTTMVPHAIDPMLPAWPKRAPMRRGPASVRH